MECELCGREIEQIRKVRVENSILNVCGSCVKYGTEVQFSLPQEVPATTVQAPVYTPPMRKIKSPYAVEAEEYELSEEWPRQIREAREKLGWDRKEFGRRIGERASVIERLESGRMLPEEKLLKKLEKTLRIRIKENI